MTRCRACRSDRLDPVFEMDPMPLAGAFAPTADDARAMPRYPLTWLLCHDCGLVNVTPDIPDADIFATYSYAASTVPGLVRHHRAFAADLSWRYDAPRLLEIGCNDGVLLRELPPNWEKVGVDPSDVARSVTGDWDLVPLPFTADLALGQFDVVTSSNSFAHFSDIAGALDGVRACLKPGGDFWIEVHDLAATLRTGQWDTIYHEHKVEWSIHSLCAAIEPRGFELRGAWSLDLHGGLIRARFTRTRWANHPRPTFPDFSPLRQSYAGRAAPRLAPHSAAYGAAARATVYLNQTWPMPIDYIVDGSPLRAGRFVPGIGIPVVSPADFDAPETTLITAWNHAADIRASHPTYDGWVSAW